MPGIFLSYARETTSAAKTLAEDMEKLGYATWLDQDLYGGKAWWEQILAQIRDCEIFVLALSPDSVRSTACSREASYAEALGKPILPVMVAEGVGVLPARLSKIHYVDYRKQDRDALADLARALRATPPAAALPQPLPEPPAIPLSYLERIAEQIDAETPLSSKDQSEIVSELRGGLNEPETAADARALLERFAMRPELLARIGREIEELLGDAPAPRKADPATATQTANTPAGGRTSNQQKLPTGSPPSASLGPAVHATRWGVAGAILMLWVIVSPIAVAGILSAANAFIVIPVTAVLLAVIWPIRPVHAALLTIVVNTTNLVASLAVHDMWEKDQRVGLAALSTMIVVDAALAALISRHRLSRMQQRR